MLYLQSFSLPDERTETSYIISTAPDAYKSMMSCYSQNLYPFKIFPQKQFDSLSFEPITLLYGGNGSGKSTLLNVLARKLNLEHDSPYNNTPFFEEYLSFCKYSLAPRQTRIPRGSRIITSDDVFDFLLNIRSLNEGVDRRREELFDEYRHAKEESFTLRSLSNYEELKRHNEAKSKTKNSYVARRLPDRLTSQSNGESAFAYFCEKIGENALYLLDEPENSLSPLLQLRLARFLEDSARFFGCQFVISTHSPFLLAMKGARIYDLDRTPVTAVHWTETQNARLYHAFFKTHAQEFVQDETDLRDFLDTKT